MCGIVGFLAPPFDGNEEAARRTVAQMRDRIAHRGPDDAGTWLDPAAGLAFGFRRLSIVDLSPAGHQPMVSADGRFAIVMNGEIYNYEDIRAEVDATGRGVAWRGHCDTEVLLEAVALWGVEAAVSRTNGMFAFAVWDRKERELWLGRDRIGKKPLYYGWAGDTFTFGSELKALWQHPQFDFRISPEALTGYLQLGYVLGQDAIFASMNKLPAGHLLRLGQRDAARRTTPAPTPYWSLRDAALAGLEEQAAGRSATREELEALISDAVRLRMVADVPVGAFLSGGVDSSLVTALMAANAGGSPVHTFAIGFDIPEWNEAQHAKAVASHLGTRHEEQYLSGADTIGVLHDVPTICDEPFADDSIIPTTLLCRMARRSVTVALSGDGGDELFAGYQRYGNAARWLARRDALPGPARAVAGSLVDLLARPAAGRWGSQKLERRFHLLSHLLGDTGPERFQDFIMSQSLEPGRFLAQFERAPGRLAAADYVLGKGTPIDRMTFIDSLTFMIDDILAKVDRASMSTSLEVRAPLLDYRVIELSWRFPSEAKCSNGVGKIPLRETLYRYVPKAIVDRPKMGFSAPVEEWVKDKLRGWAEGLLSREALSRHGLLDVDACRRLWEDFAERGRGWDRAIWNLLMFQAWYATVDQVRRGHASAPAQGAAQGTAPDEAPRLRVA